MGVCGLGGVCVSGLPYSMLLYICEAGVCVGGWEEV